MINEIEFVERRDLLAKIMADMPLTYMQWTVIELLVVDELTYWEVGAVIDATSVKVRQIYAKAMLKLRRHASRKLGSHQFKILFGRLI